MLDVSNPMWAQDGYFTEAEMSEIRSFNCPTLPAVPADLQEYLNTHDGQVLYIRPCSTIEFPILTQVLVVVNKNVVFLETRERGICFWGKREESLTIDYSYR